jgi:membrane-associated protease RseP (regulator of RpoE activity)
LENIVSKAFGTRITLVVDRGGRDLTLHATPVNGQTITFSGEPKLKKPHGYLGIDIANLQVRQSWYGAIPGSVTEVGSLIALAAHAIVHVFSPGEFSSLFHQVASATAATNKVNQSTRPASIVGVVRFAVQSTQAGPTELLLVLAAVNIFVGLLNMLPMLPLDGGYVAIATYERLRSRRGVRYHADINKMAPFAYAFMGVLLVLFACTLFLDIAHPIANPFR